MSFATDKWFRHLREEILVEGVADLGLPDTFVKMIRNDLQNASEKGRVWVGNALKDFHSTSIWSRSRHIRDYVSNRENAKLFKKGDSDFNFLTDYAHVLQNQPVAKWKKAHKSFVKNSRKLGVSDEKILELTNIIKNQLYPTAYTQFRNRIPNVFIALEKNPNNYELIKGYPTGDLRAAEEEMYKYVQQLEEEDQIIHRFDDGSYWYDLESHQCDVEGGRMGHCGRDSNGHLYSLRKFPKGKKFSNSYVTLSYNSHEDKIYQIKGRSNEVPPEKTWDHIVWFIDNMGVDSLGDIGEYANDPHAFQELTDYLTNNTDITPSDTIEQKMDELREEVMATYNDFIEEYGDKVLIDEPSIDSDDYGTDAGDIAFWHCDFDAVCVQLPFMISDRDLKWAAWDDHDDEILSIIDDEDSNDLTDRYYQDNYQIFFTKANNPAEALGKSRWQTNRDRMPHGGLLSGSKTFIVVSNLAEGIREAFNYHSGENYSGDGFDYFIEIGKEFLGDLEDSIDTIQDYMIGVGLIDKPKLKIYIEKIEEEFNNFIVSTANVGIGHHEIFASGTLFHTTPDQMETILGPLNFLEGFNKQASYYTSELFKTAVVNILQKKEDEAIDFAKRQMKLNFGEQYEEKIENIFTMLKDKEIGNILFDEIFVGFDVKKSKKVPASAQPGHRVDHRADYFTYKIIFMLTERTLPVFGPILEYYDNNFKLVIDAFDKTIKTMIADKTKKFRDTTNSGTNLPLQEVDNPLDVRLYEIKFVMSYPLGLGFEMTDIHNIIRAIPDVTTVRTLGNTKRTQANRTISLQLLKFALQGQKNRMQWVKETLLPQVKKISRHIRIHNVKRADLVTTSHSLREYQAYSQHPSTAMVTPRGSIQQVLDDWMGGGVMYDTPTNTNLSRYHVMIPVVELEPYMSRLPRKHGHHFDAGYENFIANGPVQPIYLAVGKNGRVRITGNEDDLRYALKAGVKEVPVFFSYQRQV